MLLKIDIFPGCIAMNFTLIIFYRQIYNEEWVDQQALMPESNK